MNIQKYFKPAASENPVWNVAKTLFQTTLFWGFFLVLLPEIIMYFEGALEIPTFQKQPNSGLIVFVICSLLGLWSGMTMSIIGRGTPLPTDCPNELVVKGPYRFVRNPMAVAGIGQGISIGLFFGSFLVIIYALLGAVLWHYLVRPEEEKDLEKRFGAAYLDYKNRVKCWIPF